MSDPQALIRARHLQEFRAYSHTRHQDLAVILSTRDAWELLEWLRAGPDWAAMECAELTRDYAEALATDNPFVILKNFQLLGFDLIPGPTLH